ncbi:hypothetical protein F5Y16DRAFT_400682 [Xylariaceae sp. FL0255]|nr:hypothetical protein F5Y16DRAFT_400682 [Xylariaceae sp. FL0255]
MVSITPFTIAVFSLLGIAQAACYSGESSDLLCYNIPQNSSAIYARDMANAAWYLRGYGAEVPGGRLFTMPAENIPECAEWTLYEVGSALVLAKHINSTLNSSVLYSDIAFTIDGGFNNSATDPNDEPPFTENVQCLMDCPVDYGINTIGPGGSFGVRVNGSDPAYNASTYPVGYTPDGILIKIVWSGQDSVPGL